MDEGCPTAEKCACVFVAVAQYVHALRGEVASTIREVDVEDADAGSLQSPLYRLEAVIHRSASLGGDEPATHQLHLHGL